MPSEDPILNQTPKHKSLESLKKTFRERLDVVLYKQLTIENIETFADEALVETISLTDDILAEYRRNPNVKASPTTLDTQAQENEAFAILDLPNINEILQSIINVKDKIDSLKTYIHENTENIDEVITPPQPDHITEITPGDKSFERKKMFPRLLTLLYVVEHDFEITPTPENVPIKEGIVTPKMMRKTPYTRVEIPVLERAVYICDEEGNASYVFDTAKLAEVKLTLEEIDLDDKGDKNSLIAYHPGIGVRIIQSIHWRDRVATALKEKIPEIQTGIPEQHKREERKRISEFERPKFLPFNEFKEQVEAMYPGQGDVQRWYKREQKKHPNWPSTPQRTYKNRNWLGWSELVEMENRLKKEWLSFEEFKAEVKTLYPGQGDVQKWYRGEQKKHPNWPYHPNKNYKNIGWLGWSELVEMENRLKKEWLSFEEFKAEVKTLYSGSKGGVVEWYWKEKKNHPNWPFNPDKMYRNMGWVSWLELVGK